MLTLCTRERERLRGSTVASKMDMIYEISTLQLQRCVSSQHNSGHSTCALCVMLTSTPIIFSPFSTDQNNCFCFTYLPWLFLPVCSFLFGVGEISIGCWKVIEQQKRSLKTCNNIKHVRFDRNAKAKKYFLEAVRIEFYDHHTQPRLRECAATLLRPECFYSDCRKSAWLYNRLKSHKF